MQTSALGQIYIRLLLVVTLIDHLFFSGGLHGEPAHGIILMEPLFQLKWLDKKYLSCQTAKPYPLIYHMMVLESHV